LQLFCHFENNYIFVSLKTSTFKKKDNTVAYENNDKKMESVYSIRVKAGKRRTYFFDVRETRGNDFYVTITESRKRFDSDGYDRHKIFLYKEDFNKFLKGLNETVEHVKTELMPDFDFDAFNHDTPYEGEDGQVIEQQTEVSDNTAAPVTEASPIITTSEIDLPPAGDNGHAEEVDKW
jgi:hypothetical protein